MSASSVSLKRVPVAALGVVCAALGVAGPLAAAPAASASACHSGVLHVALMSRAQMCPRPLATTVIARPHPRTVRT